MPTLFQAGTLIGITHGIYDGDVDFKTLTQHGDIGFGLLNGIDGEMIAVDGNFYHIGHQGKVEIIHEDVYTPFSIVSKFKPTHSFSIENLASLDDLEILISSHCDTSNIFYMIRVDAEFEMLKISSDTCQMRPLIFKTEKEHPQPLNEDFQNVTGTLVITRCPDFSSAFTLSGYHTHFIDHARKLSGHAADCKIQKAKVMITPIRRFSMVLSHSKSFDEANLNN
jgi:acetolactate decarboxylase